MCTSIQLIGEVKDDLGSGTLIEIIVNQKTFIFRTTSATTVTASNDSGSTSSGHRSIASLWVDKMISIQHKYANRKTPDKRLCMDCLL